MAVVFGIVGLIWIVYTVLRLIEKNRCDRCRRLWAMKKHFEPGTAKSGPGWKPLACKHCGHVHEHYEDDILG